MGALNGIGEIRKSKKKKGRMIKIESRILRWSHEAQRLRLSSRWKACVMCVCVWDAAEQEATLGAKRCTTSAVLPTSTHSTAFRAVNKEMLWQNKRTKEDYWTQSFNLNLTFLTYLTDSSNNTPILHFSTKTITEKLMKNKKLRVGVCVCLLVLVT